MKPRDWLKIAERDRDITKLLEEHMLEDYAQANAYFHIQQAIEKCLKGLLQGRVTVSNAGNIKALLKLCEENSIIRLQKLSDTTLDTITSWSRTDIFHRKNDQAYRQATELYDILHDTLNELVLDEAKNAVERLVSKISHEYRSMRERWWDMVADDLIDNAERIAAAKFARENIGSSVSDDEAAYLLRLKTPLATIVETIMFQYDPQNIAQQEWFREHLADICYTQDLDVDYETEEAEGMIMQ